MPRNRHPAKRHLKVIEGQGRRPSYFKQAAIYYIVLALVAVLVIQAGAQWLGLQILSWRLAPVVARPGYMESSTAVEGVISRYEELLKAPRSGLIVELAAGGERVSASTAVAAIVAISREEAGQFLEHPESRWQGVLSSLRRRLFNETEREVARVEVAPSWLSRQVEMINEKPGLLSFTVDGFEKMERFPYLDREAFERLYEEPAPLEVGAYVEEGQPIAKIIDNWRWYYSIVLPLHPGRTLAGYQNATLRFAFAPDNPVTAELEDLSIDTEAGAVYLTYRVERQLAGFEGLRWAGAEIIYDRDLGVLIPSEALWERQSAKGVFVNQGGIVVYYPVQVIRQQGEETLVEGLPPYSLVISRPELVHEGQRLD